MRYPFKHFRPSITSAARLCAFVLVGCFAGCQTTTLQSGSSDASAKRFVAEAGKSKVYVYRLSGLAGAARVEAVFLDGRMIGQNGPGTFLVADLPPGRHTISTTASSITVDANVGTPCFVRQKMSSWGPTSYVLRVSNTEGEQGVEACKLAQGL